ncbi:S8 family serine peptidase [Actinoplanes subglobosus]|uniref:S8 family serine peptidase n=1 Tax=Actinoplanes subglobosus TaxID=1547892 RepID=A0ABV8IUX0_9ACTN
MTISRKSATLVIIAVAVTLCPSTPAFADKVRDEQWFVDYLDLAQAHRITQGSGVSVAVVDTGISPHRDLSQNLRRGTDTSPGGDGTGRNDENGHGTRMAGLIAAHGHEAGNGAIGIAPKASLIPVRAAGKKPNGLGIPAGIKWAATHDADVINVSGSVARSRELNEAVAEAVRSDAVVVAASGNKSEDPSIANPAEMTDVLAVGAVGRDGNVADFSVTDPKVEICAPGVDMVTTDLENKYAKGRGTSQATAIVSGAAALVRAKFPSLSAPEVIHRLTSTADDNGPPGRDDECGYGVLNIVKALTADVPPLDPSGTAAPATTGTSTAGVSAPSGGGASTDAALPKHSGSNLSLIAGIGAVVIAVGVVLAVLVRRRRRDAS